MRYRSQLTLTGILSLFLALVLLEKGSAENLPVHADRQTPQDVNGATGKTGSSDGDIEFREQPALTTGGGSPDATTSSGMALSPQTGENLPAVKDGFMKEERAALLKLIYEAKAQGIGIQAYINAFKHLEGMVEKGDSRDAMRDRWLAIAKGLKEQMDRQEYLKTKPSGQAQLGQINILAPGQSVPEHLRGPYGGLDHPAALPMMKQFQDSVMNKLPHSIPAPAGSGTKSGQPPGAEQEPKASQQSTQPPDSAPPQSSQ